MTRELSTILGAREPAFRLGIHQLEEANGRPSVDIRLSTEIKHQAIDAIKELGLDPADTTGPELYGALMARLQHDDTALYELFGKDTVNDNLMIRVQRLLKKLEMPRSVFVLKATVAKRMLKKIPPKKAMKQLGYRSIDSMLKHEPPAQILAAAVIAENGQWNRSLIAQYKKLKSTDFEVRDITILAPKTKRWDQISAEHVGKYQHNILSFNELGAVVLLPLKSDTVPGAALVTVLVALHAINDIRATSTYLKLHQVRPDFGLLAAKAVRNEPITGDDIGQEKMPWKLVHNYFGNDEGSYSPELFEPHVQQEDLQTTPVEQALAKVLPRFEFWKNKSHSAFVADHQPVSLNLTDAAINFCNQLPYERRVSKYLREHLWRELMLRYMRRESVENAVQMQLNGVAEQKTLA